MCPKRKQFVTAIALIAFSLLTVGRAEAGPGRSAGGVALGDSQGGVTDRAYVSAPPNWSFVVEREPGSFLDCGTGMDARIADENGRDMAGLRCGVTLTETLAIPAAAESARIIVHF
jgi:hypothetical protein